MTTGFVYLLVNPYMPGIYKIGCTERSPSARADELSKPTGVPYPFDVLCYVEIAAHSYVERRLHDWMADFRVSIAREFFQGEPDRAVQYLYHHPERITFTSAWLDGPEKGFVYYEPMIGADPINVDLSVNVWKPKTDESAKAEGFAAFICQVTDNSIDGGL